MVFTRKFSEFDDGGDISNDKITVGYDTDLNIQYNNPWTFLASGTTGDRPTPSSDIYYRLRFNTSLLQYEFYDPSTPGWVQLTDDLSTVISAKGTANQVFVNGTFGVMQFGNLIFSLPQDIATTSSPEFNNIELDGGLIFDAAGNINLRLQSIGSAVNYINIFNNSIGQVPTITVEGTDTDIGLLLAGKGTGGVGFRTTNTSVPFNFYSGTGAQHTTNFNMADTPFNRTVTWQDSNGTVAWLTDVAGTVTSATGTANQVLVNGTIGTPETGAITLTLPQDIATTSSPEFNNIQLDGGEILDLNGNIVLELVGVSSAVNYLRIGNDIAGAPPFLTPQGTDANIGISLVPKGDAGVGFDTSAVSAVPFLIRSGTSAQHSTNFLFANTANARNVTFQDSSGTVAWLTDIPAGSPSALTKTDDTNVTLTLGGTPSTALLEATSLTLGWTGQLSLTRGGTNNSLTASAGGILWSDSTKLNILSGTGTANQILLSGNAVTPAWSTTTYPTTNAINTIMYASSANVLGVITPVNSAVLISSAGGVPSMSTTLPSGIAATNMNLTTPTLGVASATSVNFSSTSGIIGTTTNNNAAAGSVGELISSVIPAASSVSFTNGVTSDLTSISLTAGDWDVYGNILFSGTTITQGLTWISLTSATIPDISLINYIAPNATSMSVGMNAPYFRASISSTTTIYISGYVAGTGTLTGVGGIYARRIR